MEPNTNTNTAEQNVIVIPVDLLDEEGKKYLIQLYTEKKRKLTEEINKISELIKKLSGEKQSVVKNSRQRKKKTFKAVETRNFEKGDKVEVFFKIGDATVATIVETNERCAYIITEEGKKYAFWLDSGLAFGTKSPYISINKIKKLEVV